MKKRILHYAILALLLLGAPFAFCLLSGRTYLLEGLKNFPPRTEDWGFHPELLWNHRRPFNWGVFAGLFLFTAWSLKPFVKRALKRLFAGGASSRVPGRFPWWGWLGTAVLAGGWLLSWNGRLGLFPPLPVPLQVQLSYAPVWAGFILTMNGLCVKRSGHSPMTDHPWAYAATFPASSLFWWFFEYLNRYVWNWYYLGISQLSAVEYTVYASVCFASVLPAVCAIAAWLHTFSIFDDSVYSGMARIDLKRPRYMALLAFLSVLGLAGIVYIPEYTYFLIWISPLMVFLILQHLLKEPSTLLDSLKNGNWSIVIRFQIATLICGFCWEMWNFYAYAKWVYAVPWVHRFQIWEMPLMGYAGYLPFGVECAAVTAWILPALTEPPRQC